jgi:hypothetical protein
MAYLLKKGRDLSLTVQPDRKKRMADVLKKVHDLRLHKALICSKIPFPESNSRLSLRLRELQLIFAEFMGFFRMFAIVNYEVNSA